jgi:hypothetical protein
VSGLLAITPQCSTHGGSPAENDRQTATVSIPESCAAGLLMQTSCYDDPVSSAETDGALFFGLEAPEMSISGSPFLLVR